MNMSQLICDIALLLLGTENFRHLRGVRKSKKSECNSPGSQHCYQQQLGGFWERRDLPWISTPSGIMILILLGG